MNMEKDIKMLKFPQERKYLSFTEHKALSAIPEFPWYLTKEVSGEIARGGLPDIAAGGLNTPRMKEILFQEAVLPNLTVPAIKTDLTPLLLKGRGHKKD